MSEIKRRCVGTAAELIATIAEAAQLAEKDGQPRYILEQPGRLDRRNRDSEIVILGWFHAANLYEGEIPCLTVLSDGTSAFGGSVTQGELASTSA